MEIQVTLLYEHSRAQFIDYMSRSSATRAEPDEIRAVWHGSDQSGVEALLAQPHTVAQAPDGTPDLGDVRAVLSQFVSDYNALGNSVELKFRHADGTIADDPDNEPHCVEIIETEDGQIVLLNWDCEAITSDPALQAILGKRTGMLHVGARSVSNVGLIA